MRLAARVFLFEHRQNWCTFIGLIVAHVPAARATRRPGPIVAVAHIQESGKFCLFVTILKSGFGTGPIPHPLPPQVQGTENTVP